MFSSEQITNTIALSLSGKWAEVLLHVLLHSFSKYMPQNWSGPAASLLTSLSAGFVHFLWSVATSIESNCPCTSLFYFVQFNTLKNLSCNIFLLMPCCYLHTHWGFLVLFWGWGFETGSLCVALACPGTHSIDKAGLELTEVCLALPLDAEIKACTTMIQIKGFYLFLIGPLYLWPPTWLLTCIILLPLLPNHWGRMCDSLWSLFLFACLTFKYESKKLSEF